MSDYVFDASAVIALLNGEPGAERIAEALLDDVLISAVNLAEVVSTLSERGGSDEDIRANLEPLNLTVWDFETNDAYSAGFLRRHTRRFGLSLGDRACLGLAQKLGLPVLTADRAWSQLDVGVRVEVFR